MVIQMSVRYGMEAGGEINRQGGEVKLNLLVGQQTTLWMAASNLAHLPPPHPPPLPTSPFTFSFYPSSIDDSFLFTRLVSSPNE